LKEIIDIYETGDIEKFVDESAKFIAEGMDYICNV